MLGIQNSPLVGSVSHGTLRAEDLIPAFMGALEDLAPEEATRIRTTPEYHEWFNSEADTVLYDGGADFIDWILDDLFDTLNEKAPEGLYFGAIEGDGSDFGFWPDADES